MSVLSAVIGRGVLASRPAAGSPGRVFFVTDGTPGLFRDNGSSWDSIGESGATVTWADLDDDHDLHDHTGVPGVGGGSGGADPIASVFGTPTTAYDFAVSSLAGLTALGTPTAEAAHTTIPDHYYAKMTGAAYAWVGRHATPPAAPFTAITKVNGFPRADFNSCGLFIGIAAPGTMDILTYAWESGSIRPKVERVTPSAFGSVIATQYMADTQSPIYLAIRAVSATDVDFLFSFDGYIWRYQLEARNPAITIGSVGIAVKSESATHPMAAAFDYLRLWNTAKTFYGVD